MTHFIQKHKGNLSFIGTLILIACALALTTATAYESAQWRSTMQGLDLPDARTNATFDATTPAESDDGVLYDNYSIEPGTWYYMAPDGRLFPLREALT